MHVLKFYNLSEANQSPSVSNSQRGWSCEQFFDSLTTFLNPLVGTNSLYGKRTVAFFFSRLTRPTGESITTSQTLSLSLDSRWKASTSSHPKPTRYSLWPRTQSITCGWPSPRVLWKLTLPARDNFLLSVTPELLINEDTLINFSVEMALSVLNNSRRNYLSGIWHYLSSHGCELTLGTFLRLQQGVNSKIRRPISLQLLSLFYHPLTLQHTDNTNSIMLWRQWH